MKKNVTNLLAILLVIAPVAAIAIPKISIDPVACLRIFEGVRTTIFTNFASNELNNAFGYLVLPTQDDQIIVQRVNVATPVQLAAETLQVAVQTITGLVLAMCDEHGMEPTALLCNHSADSLRLIPYFPASSNEQVVEQSEENESGGQSNDDGGRDDESVADSIEEEQI